MEPVDELKQAAPDELGPFPLTLVLTDGDRETVLVSSEDRERIIARYAEYGGPGDDDVDNAIVVSDHFVPGRDGQWAKRRLAFSLSEVRYLL